VLVAVDTPQHHTDVAQGASLDATGMVHKHRVLPIPNQDQMAMLQKTAAAIAVHSDTSS
jgi:hypothetical protein